MSTSTETNIEERDTISFIRYPIFKMNHQLWGYRVRCIDKHGDAGHRIPGDGDVSELVSSNSYLGLEKLLSQGRSLMVDFSQQSILKSIPYALPQSNSAIRIKETTRFDDPLISALKKLKSDGYRIAISRFSGKNALSDIYKLADILCMKTAGRNREELSEMMEAARPFNAKVMGEMVRDREHFIRCSELGFALFQGSFFKTPEKISVRKISSNEAARFKLMKIIEGDTPDFEKLADTIQSDVTISLRLLTYLNSAAFGLVSKISSIQQAITMLGWENMKKWLRVVILSDVSKHTYAQDLVMLSSQRGKFLEIVIEDHDFWGFSPDSMFLLGVFSLLDTLLGMPMEKITAHLPLEEKLKSALLRDTNSEYTPFIKLAEYMEDAEWEQADRMIQQLSMNREKVKSAFHSAVEWANELTSLHS